MNWKPELDDLARREAFAREMGGADKVKRQRDQGRLNVRERIDKLLDQNSFHEVGAVSGVVGSVLSSQIPRLPTGPTIVLVATAFVIVSLLVAPERGLLWTTTRLRRQQRRFTLQQTLAELHRLADARNAAGTVDAITVGDLAQGLSKPESLARKQIDILAERGFVRKAASPDGWELTPLGMEAASRAQHRETLWKMYLARQMDIPISAVHVSMEEIEQMLPQEVLREFNATIDRQRQEERASPASAVPMHGQV